MELIESNFDSPDERRALALSLEKNRSEVERRWLERVGSELNHHGLSETQLRDSIPDYLVSIAQQLRRNDAQTAMDRGTHAWTRVAKEHALARSREGFDIDELMLEFLLLRRVLLEVCGERANLTPVQTELITRLIHGALIASVKSYVDHRDYLGRQEQAKHIGFITHELRNPLSTAMASAGQLRKRGIPEQARCLDLLERNHQRLSELIDDTLLSQRLEVNAVESHPTDVTVGDLLEQALRNAEETTRLKGVELEVSCDPSVLLHVDRKLAVSALQNIVDNAAKFTDRGLVEIDIEEAPNEVVVHVFDDCAGLSPEELRTIFEPFKRGHSGKTGNGLGLAIARRAVEAHGKTIHAESTGSKGCHFWFSLPKVRH
jgi:signal transduction histidine kinase